MTFRVGQKAVCVDAKRTNSFDIPELREGAVYQIRWTDGIDVRLHEQTFRDKCGSDMPYRASRFRPIVERKADISIFTKMLTPEGVDA